MKLQKLYLFLTCMGIAMIAGCGGGEESAATEEEIAPPSNFNITMVNQKSETLTDITIQGMALPVKFGKVKSGSSQTLLAKRMDISDKVTVSWSNSRGNRDEADVKIKGKIPKRFKGSLKFTIQSSGRVQFQAD